MSDINRKKLSKSRFRIALSLRKINRCAKKSTNKVAAAAFEKLATELKAKRDSLKAEEETKRLTFLQTQAQGYINEITPEFIKNMTDEIYKVRSLIDPYDDEIIEAKILKRNESARLWRQRKKLGLTKARISKIK
jgi:hypothetical protein